MIVNALLLTIVVVLGVLAVRNTVRSAGRTRAQWRRLEQRNRAADEESDKER